jgi:hypothetical protein
LEGTKILETTISLFYNIHENYFVNEDGDVIDDSIYEIVSPDYLYLFYQGGEDMYVPHQTMKGVVVELFFPTDCDACVNFDCEQNPFYEWNYEEDDYE